MALQDGGLAEDGATHSDAAITRKVPEPRRRVRAARGEEATVRGKGEPADGVRVLPLRGDLLPGRYVPESHGPVFADRGQDHPLARVPAVGREGDGGDVIGVP